METKPNQPNTSHIKDNINQGGKMTGQTFASLGAWDLTESCETELPESSLHPIIQVQSNESFCRCHLHPRWDEDGSLDSFSHRNNKGFGIPRKSEYLCSEYLRCERKGKRLKSDKTHNRVSTLTQVSSLLALPLGNQPS